MNLSSPYPAEISLADEGKKGFVYRLSSNSFRLYVHDLDKGGRPSCDKKCMLVWSPIMAPPASKKLGDWTPVQRGDGYVQWAYRGKPVYYRYGDTPANPKGDGKEGGKWHLVPYEK